MTDLFQLYEVGSRWRTNFGDYVQIIKVTPSGNIICLTSTERAYTATPDNLIARADRPIEMKVGRHYLNGEGKTVQLLYQYKDGSFMALEIEDEDTYTVMPDGTAHPGSGRSIAPKHVLTQLLPE